MFSASVGSFLEVLQFNSVCGRRRCRGSCCHFWKFCGVSALSDDLPRVLGPFFCWEIWPAFLGVVAAAVLLMLRRSPAVGVLSLCCGLSARYVIGRLFCSCAGLNLNYYEFCPAVNRLKHSGCAKNQDQFRGYELTNMGCVILSQKIWRAGLTRIEKLSLIQSAAAIPCTRAREEPWPESWEEKTRRAEAGRGLESGAEKLCNSYRAPNKDTDCDVELTESAKTLLARP